METKDIERILKFVEDIQTSDCCGEEEKEVTIYILKAELTNQVVKSAMEQVREVFQPIQQGQNMVKDHSKDIYGPGNDNYGRDKFDNEAIIQHIQNALKLTSKETFVVLCPNCGSSSEVYASLGKCHCANCGKLWSFDNSESSTKQEPVKPMQEVQPSEEEITELYQCDTKEVMRGFDVCSSKQTVKTAESFEKLTNHFNDEETYIIFLNNLSDMFSHLSFEGRRKIIEAKKTTASMVLRFEKYGKLSKNEGYYLSLNKIGNVVLEAQFQRELNSSTITDGKEHSDSAIDYDSIKVQFPKGKTTHKGTLIAVNQENEPIPELKSAEEILKQCFSKSYLKDAIENMTIRDEIIEAMEIYANQSVSDCVHPYNEVYQSATECDCEINVPSNENGSVSDSEVYPERLRKLNVFLKDYTLHEILNELKWGKPAEFQKKLNKMIKILDSNIIKRIN